MSNLEEMKAEILKILKIKKEDSIYRTGIVKRDYLIQALTYSPDIIDKAIQNLEAYGLIKIEHSIMSRDWVSCWITKRGESESDSIKLKEMKLDKSKEAGGTHQTITIQGPVTGDVIQANKSKILKKTVYIKEFEEARSLIVNNNQILHHIREESLAHLDILEEENSKEKPIKSRIERSWIWIKNNLPRQVESVLTKIIAGLLLRAI